MHSRGTIIQMKKKMYVTNLSKKTKSLTSKCKNEWKINGTNYVPTASATFGVKTEYALLNIYLYVMFLVV
jgi:hypothetical protein